MNQPPFDFQLEHVMGSENEVNEEPVILTDMIHRSEEGLVLL